MKRVGKVNLPNLRQLPPPVEIFCDLARDALAWLRADINAKIPLNCSEYHRQKAQFSEQEMWVFAGMILGQLGQSASSERVWLDNKDRMGLNRNRWEKLTSLLEYSEVQLFTRFNQSFKIGILNAGECTLDETMWKWEGEHQAVVHIPRKPVDLGIKVFTISFRFKLTQKPYCFNFLPDLLRPAIGVSTALTSAFNLFRSGPTTALTADSWFGSFNWAITHASDLYTFALSSSVEPELCEFFGKNLKQGEYRLFSNSRIIISIYFDVAIVRTVTNCYEVVGKAMSPPAHTSLEAAGVMPRLSAEGMSLLLSLKQSDLQSLAAFGGEAISKYYFFVCLYSSKSVSVGGSKEDLVHKIAARPLQQIAPEGQQQFKNISIFTKLFYN